MIKKNNGIDCVKVNEFTNVHYLLEDENNENVINRSFIDNKSSCLEKMISCITTSMFNSLNLLFSNDFIELLTKMSLSDCVEDSINNIFNDGEIISNIVVSGIHFGRCIFKSCIFENVKFYNCTFDYIGLDDTEFKGIYFGNCNIKNMILNNSNIDTNILFNTTIDNIYVLSSNLKYPIFVGNKSNVKSIFTHNNNVLLSGSDIINNVTIDELYSINDIYNLGNVDFINEYFVFKNIHDFNLLKSKYVIDGDLKYIDDIFFSVIYNIELCDSVFFVYNTKDINVVDFGV